MTGSTLKTRESGLGPSAQEALFNYYGVGDIDYARPDLFALAPSRFTETTQRAYPFTTENMVDYMAELGLNGKDIAAVAGSNDFAINAFMEGARSVDSVDSMPTACLYAELKTAAITTMGREEFLAFFNDPEGNGYFNVDQYGRLRPLVSAQTRHFFDQLVQSGDDSVYISKGFFIDKIENPSLYQNMNPYLRDDKGYEAARKNIGNMLFHPVNMSEFLENAQPESYDVVYLSNIFGYMKKEEVGRLLALAASRLKPGGAIVDFSFVYPTDRGGVDCEDHQQERAGLLGLKARHVIGTVPHMDRSEPGDSGFRSFVSILEKAA